MLDAISRDQSECGTVLVRLPGLGFGSNCRYAADCRSGCSCRHWIFVFLYLSTYNLVYIYDMGPTTHTDAAYSIFGLFGKQLL